MPTVSILTAFLNEESNLPLFRTRVLAALRPLGVDYEIVLIDDHSTDGSRRLAQQWLAEDPHVRYIRLSRNCGSHAAYSAGLAHCVGDCAILLAADLQDPPEMIPELLARWEQGHDVVWATRAARQGESWGTKLFAALYYRMMRRFALPDMPTKGADFLLMDRKVLDAYNTVAEKNTSLLAMVLWLGFRQTSVAYTKQARHSRVGVQVAEQQKFHGESWFRERGYFTMEVAMFGLPGLTSRVRVFGTTTRSMSSIGMAPSKTSSPITKAPAKPTRFLKCSSTGPT